jgi:cytochrome c oxidase subunit 2
LAANVLSRSASVPVGLVDTRAEYQHVFDIYVPIALGVFALIVVIALFAVLRFGRRPPERAARWHEHNRIEGGYAVLLTATIAFLLYVTYSAEHRVDTLAARERPQLVVDVIGAKWEWHFHYPAYGIDLYSGAVGRERLVVPTGEAIRFSMSSLDVIHAFWIPTLRYKHDLIPGSVQNATLTFARAGVYGGQCAEFCGLLHADMLFEVLAVPPARFEAWVRSHAPAAPAAGARRARART